MAQANPVWFITGCSTGFGRELAELVVARGWRAVVTARDKGRVADLAKGHEANVLAVSLDVTDAAQIEAAAKAAADKFGRIDVLVNNAGYGYQAAIEEGEEKEIRAQFDANVFGLFAMTRAVLPVMRAAKERPYHQHHLGGGIHRLRRLGLLFSVQACGRGLVGRAGQGGRTARHARHLRRAGTLPHGLGRPLAEADAQQDRRLCRDRGRPSQGHVGRQRQAGRRPASGRRAHDRDHAGCQPTAPAGARRLGVSTRSTSVWRACARSSTLGAIAVPARITTRRPRLPKTRVGSARPGRSASGRAVTAAPCSAQTRPM